MSREYADYAEEFMTYLDEKDTTPVRDIPRRIELSFKSKKNLKRDIWDNARSHGWLA